MKKINLSLTVFCLVALNVHAATRYVTPAGAGLLNGTSWVNAFPGNSLQTAINASAPGDEVWVMAGTYSTTATNNRNIYFSMANGVAVYGSFAGTEILLSQRVFSCGFNTVLSAEIGLPGIADNSYHVISNNSVNSTAVLDGFTISGANANFDLLGNDNRSLGGGMLNNAANGGTCSPTVRNCLFTGNTALFGAGIFNHGQNNGNANPVITNCIFAFNTAANGGGGIDNFGYNGNASPIITNSIFYNNTAVNRAGAMYCWGGGNGNASPTVLNCAFINNATIDGGAIVADRSDFAPGNSGTANPTLRNCIFWGNTASGTGPQFYIIGGAGFEAVYTVIDITNQGPPHAITGPGTGNSNTAPAFINSANAIGADNCWLTGDDGLQLQALSAGVDAGNNAGVPAFDIRNRNRIVNVVVDMGPYEFSPSVLPLSLTRFYGRSARGANMLFWETATESNNHFFEIQRSKDAVLFERAGLLDGFGNSSSLRQYRFTDSRLVAPEYYYRLKQVDYNGQYAYSNIIRLNNSNSNAPGFTVSPNPVINRADIFIRQASLGSQNFLLVNSNGIVVDKLIVRGNAGSLNLSNRAAGLYYLVSQKTGETIKLVKMLQ
jgi:hypothetical protein